LPQTKFGTKKGTLYIIYPHTSLERYLIYYWKFLRNPGCVRIFAASFVRC